MSEELNEIARNIRAEIEAQLAIKEAQLKIAIEALEKISKITIEVSFYKEPTYEAQIAKEALEQIKKGE